MSTLAIGNDFKPAKDALPCPFCGGSKIFTYEYEHHAGEKRIAIMCAECVAMIDPGWVRTRDIIIDMWNKRKAGEYADTSKKAEAERPGRKG